ncbi:MAG: type IV pilus modification protein PilV [Ectothiorhodospiraceae bacterium]|nr:type IV pilus modification protein PilV [Ectothiorhodospiraceae bacterium]
MHMQEHSPQQKQKGFTLIEVLVTLVILAIGLLGLAGLQAASLQHNNSAYQRSQATFLAYEMLDRMRSNPQGLEADVYNAIDTGSLPGDPGCISSSCTPADLASTDTEEWATNLAAALPSGRGIITGTAANAPFTVTVMWDDERTGATGTGCDSTDATDMTCFSVTGQVFYDRLSSVL